MKLELGYFLSFNEKFEYLFPHQKISIVFDGQNFDG